MWTRTPYRSVGQLKAMLHEDLRYRCLMPNAIALRLMLRTLMVMSGVKRVENNLGHASNDLLCFGFNYQVPLRFGWTSILSRVK